MAAIFSGVNLSSLDPKTAVFFSESNLAALREIALREAAGRVDEDVVELRKEIFGGENFPASALITDVAHDFEEVPGEQARCARMGTEWLFLKLHDVGADLLSLFDQRDGRILST